MIDWKAARKSSTIKSLVLILIVIVMQMLGIGQAEVGETIDSVGNVEGQGAERLMQVLLLILTANAARGRAKAQAPLMKKKELP